MSLYLVPSSPPPVFEPHYLSLDEARDILSGVRSNFEIVVGTLPNITDPTEVSELREALTECLANVLGFERNEMVRPGPQKSAPESLQEILESLDRLLAGLTPEKAHEMRDDALQSFQEGVACLTWEARRPRLVQS